MNENRSYYFFSVCLTVFILFLSVQAALAQQSDTVQVTKELKQEEPFFQPYHKDRSVGNLYMPASGRYNVPEPKRYYRHPFMGQKYLEIALAAYYNKLKNKSLLYQFISTIAPFVDNRFTFAVYRIYDLPIVERDNPLLDPQLNEKKYDNQSSEKQ